jgi:light-regulated signal transduction histidine kinase (bacteriophytochrome)
MNELAAAAIKEIEQTTAFLGTIKMGRLIPVMADYTLLLHVMINLLSNAIKYSAKTAQPLIHIKCKRVNGELVFTVKDNGVGFDMQYAHKLFGVFQRLHSAEDFPGTGVGLAIVQRIVHKHKGKIWAEGKAGHGASFHFSLPEN